MLIFCGWFKLRVEKDEEETYNGIEMNEMGLKSVEESDS